jgi:WD40 repeat protein
MDFSHWGDLLTNVGGPLFPGRHDARGKPLTEPLRHKGPVTSAAFSSDGRRIVTASEDQTARVWDAQSSLPLGEPLRHLPLSEQREQYYPPSSRSSGASRGQERSRQRI